MTDTDTDRPPPRGGPRVQLEVTDADGRLGPAAERWLREHAGRALDLLGTAAEVRVRVLGDADMAAAHQRHKGLPGPTDVLTFDLSERPGVLDIDMLLGFGPAQREAELRGHPVERELLLYLVHGLLHCLGHDDQDAAAAARMHAEEDRILESLGVGATYARPEARP
jgi:probable rRNA maturation factor